MASFTLVTADPKLAKIVERAKERNNDGQTFDDTNETHKTAHSATSYLSKQPNPDKPRVTSTLRRFSNDIIILNSL